MVSICWSMRVCEFLASINMIYGYVKKHKEIPSMEMAVKVMMLLFALVAAICSHGTSASSSPILDVSSLNRSTFPPGFVFGTASAAFQYEGAAKQGGRGPSLWDTFTLRFPEKIADRSNGDVAVEQYYRFKEDIRIMKDMNLDAYRFSISWSRILPKGKLSGGVNPEGVDYYNRLIDALLANDIIPFATIFHWDVPQALEDEYGGFLSRHIVRDFEDFAELCFLKFGDRVKHWITLNEPSTFTIRGYAVGDFAPGRCSAWLNNNCNGGDSAIEPYLVTHHQLLAHASAVQIYKSKFQASQKGVIGITLETTWYLPLSNSKSDKEAAARALDFNFGWFMDPLTEGNYPRSMQELVGSRLPKFRPEESERLKGSIDFLGLNYYTSKYAADAPSLATSRPSYQTDSLANITAERNGVPIGPQAAVNWLYVYPRGFRELVLHIKNKYNNPMTYITENGIGELDDPTLPLDEALIDTPRIDYYFRHLFYLQSAINDHGANVVGYFAWSLLDNFEWSSGYTVRFGINFVDYVHNLQRHNKLSAKWFKNFLQK